VTHMNVVHHNDECELQHTYGCKTYEYSSFHVLMRLATHVFCRKGCSASLNRCIPEFTVIFWVYAMVWWCRVLLQCVAECCSVLQRRNILGVCNVCCSVLQCVAVCCSVLRDILGVCNGDRKDKEGKRFQACVASRINTWMSQRHRHTATHCNTMCLLQYTAKTHCVAVCFCSVLQN